MNTYFHNVYGVLQLVDQETIHKQCLSDDSVKRIEAVYQIMAISSFLDIQQVWDDLCRLTKDENPNVSSSAASVLCSVFSHVPYEFKQQAWDVLHRLTIGGNYYVCHGAAYDIGSAFAHVPDEFKQQAWSDLVRLINGENDDVRGEATHSIFSAFIHVPYEFKQQAWNILHRLTSDEDYYVRLYAARGLGSTFSDIPDKQQALNDLIRLTSDEDCSVKSDAAEALGYVFSHVADEFKQQAWDVLHRLTSDENSDVRCGAANALGSAFFHVPDKQQAWDVLHRLTSDENSDVRCGAANALGSAFSHVPDKQQAWNDLQRLTNDKNGDVRYHAAGALGSMYSHVQDEFEQQLFNDLIRLTNDKDGDVRIISNHSLGRVCIFKASQAEKDEDYRRELENAIEFFEKAASNKISQMRWHNPAQFCLPFYRSFYTIIFNKQSGTKNEIDNYLEEAKAAIKGSESKKQLTVAIENLAKALEEVQNLRYLDLQKMKCDLDLYRKYCDHATEVMRGVEEKTPFATQTIMKGLPILDRNLKMLIAEIQERAKIACQVSKGTATQEIACSVSREVQNLIIDNLEEVMQKVEDIAYRLEKKIENIPANKYLYKKIEIMRHDPNLEKKLDAMLFVVGEIPTMKVVPEKKLDEKLKPVYADLSIIKGQLSCIRYDIFKIKLNSHNVISSLEDMEKELNKINEIANQNNSFIKNLDYNNIDRLNELNRDILDRLKEMEILIDKLPNKSEAQEFYKKLNALQQSRSEKFLFNLSSIVALISFGIQLLSYK